MSLANLCIGFFFLSSAVIDCAIIGGSKVPTEFQKQPARIGRKLLGTKYPTFSVVPPTAFKCDPGNPGYFADTEGLCQVFHLCQIDGRHDSFLCPNGTLFNQKHFVCDWWYNVDCSAAPSLYILNEVFRQPQLSGREHANVRPHSTNEFVNPEASIQNYEAPSTISHARPESTASTNHNQQVTATIAREQPHTVSHQQHSQQIVNHGEKFGSQFAGVNRMGGPDMVTITNQVNNLEKIDFNPVTDRDFFSEFTESTPTTTESFNEEKFGSNLKLQLEVEELTIIPVTSNAAFFSENNNVATTFLTLANTDSHLKTGEKLAESSDATVESVQNILSTNDQVSEELPTSQPNPVDVQTSAVVVTLNTLAVKGLDDEFKTTTPLTSPTTDLAAHFLELPANSTQESTEDMSSTNNVSIPNTAVDLTESNFLTGLEATTFPTISFSTDDALPEVTTTTAQDLIEPPIIEGLNFNIIADSKVFDFETKIAGDSTTTVPATIQAFALAFAESLITDNDISTSLRNSSQFVSATTTTSKSTVSSYTENPSAILTTVITGDDSVASALIANSDGKKTLYEKLKPVIVGDARPNIPAIYGRKIPRIGNKITKFF